MSAYKEAQENKIKGRYIELLIPVVFDEDGSAHEEVVQSFQKEFLVRRERRQLLIDVLVDQHRDLSGQAAHNIRGIYIEMQLYKDSFAKLKDHQWHIKTKGMRELSQMQIEEAAKQIERFIESSNEIVANEALLALVSLKHFKSLAYLSKFKKELSEWQMVSLLEVLMEFEKENIPSFKRWLDSEKVSILVFTLRLIRIFYQRDAEDVVVKMLEHKSREVRKEVVLTMKGLHLKGHTDLLVGLYPTETKEVRLEIIIAIGELSSGEHKQFLESLFMQDDFEISFAAAEALMKTSYVDVNDFGKMNKSLNDMQCRIRDHVTHKLLAA